MDEVMAALATGMIAGLVFSMLRLPIPAPHSVSGIAGIVGLWLGYVMLSKLIS